MEARQVMTSPILTISPGASLRQAIEMMLERRVSGLPVVNEIGQLVGMISEGDLLHRSELGTEKHRSKWLDFLVGPGRSASDYVQSHSRRVADVMTTDIVTVRETTPLEDVVRLMEKRRIKRVPVVRDGGILARHYEGFPNNKFAYAIEPIEIDRLDHYWNRPQTGKG